MILHGIDIEFFHPPELRREDRNFRCVTVGIHYLREWNVLRDVIISLPEMKI